MFVADWDGEKGEKKINKYPVPLLSSSIHLLAGHLAFPVGWGGMGWDGMQAAG